PTGAGLLRAFETLRFFDAVLVFFFAMSFPPDCPFEPRNRMALVPPIASAPRRGDGKRTLWALCLSQEIAGRRVHSRGGGAPGGGQHLGQRGERALMLRVVLGRRPRHRRLGGEARAQVGQRDLARLGEEVPVEGGGRRVPCREEIRQAEHGLDRGGER